MKNLDNPIKWKRCLIKLLIQHKNFSKLAIKGNFSNLLNSINNKSKHQSQVITVQTLLLK